MRKKRTNGHTQMYVGQKFPLTIKRLGINGEGIGYYKRKIVFVPQALPGEIVTAKVTQVKKNYAQAQVNRIRQASPDRVTPRDNYDVGGIELAHLAYPAQLQFKRDVIKQALAKFKPRAYEEYDIRPTLGMDEPYYYRNKAQFQVRRDANGQVVAGLYRPNSHQLVDLPTFSTQRPLTMKIIRTVCSIIQSLGMSTYNEKNNKGAVKTIVVRESFATGQAQLVLVTNTKELPQREQFVAQVQSRLPEVVSLMHNINPGRTSLVWGEETKHLWGQEYITEKLGQITFRLSARAFFQLNPAQTKVLYDEVKKALELAPNETLIDAYCGVGTIGLYVARDAKEVRGMDIIPEAIADARVNARLSGLSNVQYEVGGAEKWIPQWNRLGFVPDALVVDPPRTGLDQQLIETIIKYRPRKFVYVSCNPSTLARDLVQLTKVYDVEYIQSVDMFPQTARCEAVVKFSLRG